MFLKHTTFLQNFLYEIRLNHRQFQTFFNPLIFFVIVLSLFPLAISPNPDLLYTLGPGAIWIVALLTLLLTFDHLFLEDFKDGTLEQRLLQPNIIYFIFCKLSAHWIMSGLLVTILSLIFSYFFHLTNTAIEALFLSLLLGTPTLVMLGAIGRTLTLGLTQSSVLTSLLILPLYIPILILGSSAPYFAMQGLPFSGQLAWLGVLLILHLTFTPFIIRATLRWSAYVVSL